jgi:hypothetical protein
MKITRELRIDAPSNRQEQRVQWRKFGLRRLPRKALDAIAPAFRERLSGNVIRSVFLEVAKLWDIAEMP